MARVLVVDDDDTVRALIAGALEDAGHAVAESGGGTDALEKIRREAFQLVVLDRSMPGFSGLDVLAVLKGFPGRGSFKVIMCTGAGLFAQVAEALEAGADDYVVKDPAGLRALPEKAARLLAKPA